MPSQSTFFTRLAFEQKQRQRCPESITSFSHREWSSPGSPSSPCSPCSAAVGSETGILSHGSGGKASKESEDPVVNVGVAEDPVVGALGVGVPGAAPVPARVEHLVGEVLGAGPQGSSPGRGVDGLVAGEEPGVGLVLVSTLDPVPGQAGSVLGGRGGKDKQSGENCEERNLHLFQPSDRVGVSTAGR